MVTHKALKLLGKMTLLAAVALLISSSARAQNYSASGTHQCRSAEGGNYQCVVTGLTYGNCLEAESSLRAQDCCVRGQGCPRGAKSDDPRCRGGGTSTGFTINYCIPGRRF